MKNVYFAFTLVEMLLALLIVSVILSASIPVITKRINERTVVYNEYSGVPIGMIAIWGTNKPLPDNTWLECNGQAIPSGIEYEEIRQIYGSNLPDYRGVFLRGYGEVSHTKNNGSSIGNTTTIHSSADINAIQGDTIRNISGDIYQDNFLNTISGFLMGTLWSPSGVFKITKFSYPSGIASYMFADLTYTQHQINFNASFVTPTSNEIRPVNKAVRYIIKVRH